jgi:hypothetical protein
MAGGCNRYKPSMFYDPPPPAQTLGQGVDEIYQMQEENAEASKYVIYQHEFKLNEHLDGQSVGGIRLNEDGEDHLKQIAENLREGSPYPVVVERSRTSVRPGTKNGYPVHLNSSLDMQRREVVVGALLAMGIEDASEQVVIAPAFAEGLTGAEAESAYRGGLGSSNNYGSGRGGFGSSFGGIGGF